MYREDSLWSGQGRGPWPLSGAANEQRSRRPHAVNQLSIETTPNNADKNFHPVTYRRKKYVRTSFQGVAITYAVKVFEDS